jgi:hypothetical protein
MRIALVGVAGLFCFALYAIWDEPTPAERALAAKVSTVIAAHYGNLPPHNNSVPAPGGKTYEFRPARHGLVVLVTYGMTSDTEREKVRVATRKAFIDVPALEAVSLESYEAHLTSGKARFSARETVLRQDVVSKAATGGTTMPSREGVTAVPVPVAAR